MKRYLFVYLFPLFLITMCHIGDAKNVGEEALPKEVIVTGYAIGEKSIEELREAALLDAFKKAARIVVGTYVSSYTEVKMFKLVDQSITTRTSAYIEKYDILEEHKELDKYVVKARVSVNAARLYDDLDLKTVLRKLERVVEGTFEITPYVGVLFGDSAGRKKVNRVEFQFGDMDNSASFGVRLAYNITSSLGIEGTVGWVKGADFETKAKDPRSGSTESVALSSSCDQVHFHGNAVYNINIIGRDFVPYLTAGLGAVHFSEPDIRAYGETVKWDETDFAWNFGGGAKWFISKFMAIRLDVRDIVTAMEDLDMMHMIETTGGLSFIF